VVLSVSLKAPCQWDSGKVCEGNKVYIAVSVQKGGSGDQYNFFQDTDINLTWTPDSSLSLMNSPILKEFSWDKELRIWIKVIYKAGDQASWYGHCLALAVDSPVYTYCSRSPGRVKPTGT
jgi:hypothetical protein